LRRQFHFLALTLDNVGGGTDQPEAEPPHDVAEHGAGDGAAANSDAVRLAAIRPIADARGRTVARSAPASFVPDRADSAAAERSDAKVAR